MVVRINLETREQTVLKQEPHPNDVTEDEFALLLGAYAAEWIKFKIERRKGCENTNCRKAGRG